MSNAMMTACRPLQMPAPCKAVLMALADRAQPREAWPSIETLRADTCLARSTVFDSVAWLEAAGAISVIRVPGRCTGYTVTPEQFDPEFDGRSLRSRGRPQGGQPVRLPDSDPSACRTGPVHEADSASPGGGLDSPGSGLDSPGGGLGPVRLPDSIKATQKATHMNPIEPSITEAASQPSASLPADLDLQAAARNTWAAFVEAYRQRYGVDPVRNAAVNSAIKRFVSSVPRDEAPAIASHYVGSNNRWYVEKGHDPKLLAADAMKLRTEWATGRRVTADQARAVDKTASNPFARMLQEGRA